MASPWGVTRQLSAFLQTIKRCFLNRYQISTFNCWQTHWKEVPNFDFQLLVGTFKKRYQISTFNCWQTIWKKVPKFDFQLLADNLKKGTKFQLLIGRSHIEKSYQISTSIWWRRDSNNPCDFLKKKFKGTFFDQKGVSYKCWKKAHYLVRYQ